MLSLALVVFLTCTALSYAVSPLDSAKFAVELHNPLYAAITGLEEQPFFLGELEREGLNYNRLDGKIPFEVITNGSVYLTVKVGGPFMQSGPLTSGEYYIPIEARVRRASDNGVVVSKMTCTTPGEEAIGTTALIGPMRLALYVDIEAHAGAVGGIENLIHGDYGTTFSVTVAAPME